MTKIQTNSGVMVERKERRIYIADKCPVHGIRYQSFRKSRIKLGCRKCRKNAIYKNQVPMFPDEGTKMGPNNFFNKVNTCSCSGQQFDGKTWVGDHLVGCSKYKVDPYDGFAGEEGI